jgi:WD40 repeat protein
VAAPAKSNPPPSIVIPPHVDYDTLSLDRCLTGYYSEVQSLAISADRKLIFSGHGDLGCKDNTVKVWLLESGELLQDLVGHRDGVRALATLSAPQCFWSGGADGQFLSWDLATGRVTPLATAIPGGINTLLPISGGQEAIGGTSGGRIYRWSQTGQTLTYWETGSAIQGLAVDSSEQLLAAAGADGMVSIWDLRRGKLLHQMRGHSGAVKAVTMTPNGDRVMTAGADHTIRVWDVASGLTLQVLVGHERAINCLALTPDGRSLISGSDDRSVKIWHWATGNLVNSLFGHSSPVVALALTNDGRMLVTGGYGEIRTWEIDS